MYNRYILPVTPDTSGAPVAPPSSPHLSESEGNKAASAIISRIRIYIIKGTNRYFDFWRVFFPLFS